jgi:SpoIID/LytB domain protein
VSNAPPSKKPTGAPKDPAKKDDPAPDLLPTPPPAPILEPTPSPKPTPKRTEGPSATSPGALAGRTIWIWGAGDPALVGVDATGRRYRGTISVVPRGGKLTVVNHVDLETYVAGIAEEKGAGWPLEGMKTLAIAARTLGAATLGWYSRNHGNGYDICPTENCQVYLGYDGEEPIMRQATAETAGVIRTYNGRPILAMYHGNGGGQTESYKRVIDNGTDPHPYLASVKYPFADPSHWKKETTLPAMEAALRASDIAIAGTLERVEVVERGESPRVMRLKLVGSEGDQDVGGTRFASALELRSTWFDFAALGERSSAIVTGRMIAVPVPPAAGWTSSSPARPPKWWTFPLTTALALSALICAVRLAASLEAMSFGAWLLALWRTRLRVRHATS